MTDARAYVEQQFVDFRAGTGYPRWSSYLLDRTLDRVVDDDGTANDVIQTLYLLLEGVELTDVLQNFTKDVVVGTFTRFPNDFSPNGLRWLADALQDRPSCAQAYLALHSLPEDMLTDECVVAILTTLAGSRAWKEATTNLQAEANRVAVRARLSDWIPTKADERAQEDVQELLRSHTIDE